MKLKVNYTIQDMFKHDQLITAEKDNPRYLDLISLIDKLARVNPYDYVLFINLEDDENPLKYLTVYYDTSAELKSRTLTVEYHYYKNSVDRQKETAGQVKAWISSYVKENGLWRD